MGNPLLPAPTPGPMAMAPTEGEDHQKDVATFHSHANSFFDALQELSSIPQGQLTKEDVFKAVASLMGKGLFADPKAQQALIMQLTQLPDDEGALRQIIGKEMLQTAHIQNEVRQRFPEEPNA